LLLIHHPSYFICFLASVRPYCSHSPQTAAVIFKTINELLVNIRFSLTLKCFVSRRFQTPTGQGIQ
jgi:hypothetical protein